MHIFLCIYDYFIHQFVKCYCPVISYRQNFQQQSRAQSQYLFVSCSCLTSFLATLNMGKHNVLLQSSSTIQLRHEGCFMWVLYMFSNMTCLSYDYTNDMIPNYSRLNHLRREIFLHSGLTCCLRIEVCHVLVCKRISSSGLIR